jgi:hypothetical protein
MKDNHKEIAKENIKTKIGLTRAHLNGSWWLEVIRARPVKILPTSATSYAQ